MQVPEPDLDTVKKVVGMLHTASLLSVPSLCTHSTRPG